MAIVGGLDIHRRQITFDLLDTEAARPTGPAGSGHPSGATRLAGSVRRPTGRLRLRGRPASGSWPRRSWGWVSRPPGRTGRHQALRGPKRQAEPDAHHLRQLLLHGALPESWIPPGHIADARTQVRLRHALAGQRTAWQQRIHAVLFHHGLPDRSHLLTGAGRTGWLASSSPASRAARSTWPCA